MTKRAPRRLQVSGHRFLMRRMEHALYGDADGAVGSVVAPRLSFALGGVLAAIIMAGHVVFALLQGSPVPVEPAGQPIRFGQAAEVGAAPQPGG
jgi:hypothetical protein